MVTEHTDWLTEEHFEIQHACTFCLHVHATREYKRGKYHCTVDLLFDWFGISSIITYNFCFYLQNRLIQTGQTGGQRYSDTSPFSIPWCNSLSISLSFSLSLSHSGRWTGCAHLLRRSERERERERCRIWLFLFKKGLTGGALAPFSYLVFYSTGLWSSSLQNEGA